MCAVNNRRTSSRRRCEIRHPERAFFVAVSSRRFSWLAMLKLISMLLINVRGAPVPAPPSDQRLDLATLEGLSAAELLCLRTPKEPQGNSHFDMLVAEDGRADRIDDPRKGISAVCYTANRPQLISRKILSDVYNWRRSIAIDHPAAGREPRRVRGTPGGHRVCKEV